MTAENRAYQRDNQGKLLKGIRATRLYIIWASIHQRCYDPKSIDYHRYGEKGITVCEEWSRDNQQGFYNFRAWSMEHGYAEDLTIDRIDNDKGYSPDNCRWTDNKTQSRNRTSNTAVIVNGVEYKTLIEACEELNRVEDYDTIHERITRYGYTAERAFTEPIKPSKPITLCIDGKDYSTAREACRAYRLNYDTVNSYKLYHHITWTEAIEHYTAKERR